MNTIKKLLGSALIGVTALATMIGLSGTAQAHEPCDDEVTVVQPVYEQGYEQAYVPVQVYDRSGDWRRDAWRERERLRRFERMRELRAQEWRYRHRFGRFGRFGRF